MSEKDDDIHGYRIPKGGIILPSIKWFSADPAVYPYPDEFRPDGSSGPTHHPVRMATYLGLGGGSVQAGC
jgi:cytochrome P450